MLHIVSVPLNAFSLILTTLIILTMYARTEGLDRTCRINYSCSDL